MKERLIAYLGGEPYLAQMAPNILQAIGQATAFNGASAGTSSEYVKVESVYPKEQGVEILIRSNFEETRALLIILAELRMKENQTVIDTSCCYYEITNHQEIRICFKNSSNPDVTWKDLEGVIGIWWSIDDLSLCTSVQTVDMENAVLADALIAEVKIEEPRAKDGILTRVLYNRKPLMSDQIDYYYDDVVTAETAVNVMMPFKGSILTADDYAVIGVMENLEPPQLCLIIIGGQTVCYRNAKGLAGQFVVSADRSLISWEFDPDWDTVLLKEKFKAGTTAMLWCEFTLIIQDRAEPQKHYHPRIRIRSSEKAVDGEYAMEKLKIQWGCLAQGSNVTMADGSVKKIESIRPGDKVASEGDHRIVTDIICGYEKDIVVLKIAGGQQLLLTGGHPVQTDRGLVRADDLTAADHIHMINGVQEIKSLYLADYDQLVYNLILEPAGIMICNDILVGDATLQNSQICSISNDINSTLLDEWRKLNDNRPIS